MQIYIVMKQSSMSKEMLYEQHGLYQDSVSYNCDFFKDEYKESDNKYDRLQKCMDEARKDDSIFSVFTDDPEIVAWLCNYKKCNNDDMMSCLYHSYNDDIYCQWSSIISDDGKPQLLPRNDNKDLLDLFGYVNNAE